MAVLFCWENRREDKLSLENLRLATELPDAELRKTLWSLVAYPKLKRQVLLSDPANQKPTEWNENTVFWINQVSRMLEILSHELAKIYLLLLAGLRASKEWQGSEEGKN